MKIYHLPNEVPQNEDVWGEWRYSSTHY